EKSVARRTWFDKLMIRYLKLIRKLQQKRSALTAGYVTVSLGLVGVGLASIGTDIMPPSDTYDLQLRIVSPQGTRLEKAEENTLDVEALIREEVGTDAVSITSAFVGMHSPNTPI